MTASPNDLARALLFEQRLINLSEQRDGNRRIRMSHLNNRARLVNALSVTVALEAINDTTTRGRP